MDPVAASRLGAPKVLCVGEALVDVVRGGAVPGGAPANLAVGLARLGTASALLGAVGADAAGEMVAAVLREAAVELGGLQTVGQATRRVVVELVRGERSFVGFEGGDGGGGADAARFADEVGVDVERVDGVLFYASQFVAVGTLGLAFEGSREAVGRVMEVAKMCQVRVFVDVNWRPVFWEAAGKGVDEARGVIFEFVRGYGEFVKISVDEVQFLLGKEVAAVALEDPGVVLEELGGVVKGVLVTDGQNGAAWRFTGGMEPVAGRIEAFEQPNVVDTVGAGDAMLAGFLSQMFAKGGAMKLMDPECVRECVEFGAATAAICCGGAGGILPLPTREQVDIFLEKEKKKGKEKEIAS